MLPWQPGFKWRKDFPLQREGAYVRTHTNTHAGPLEREPVHLVLMLSHTLTSLLHARAGTSSCAPDFKHKGRKRVKMCWKVAENSFI